MRDRHINMHLDLRPFHCPVCAKKFKMKHHLTEHMKTHTGLKPYDCLGCGKKFMWRDSFMRHRAHCERRGGLRDVSEGSGEPRGRCEDGGELMASPHLLTDGAPGGEGRVQLSVVSAATNSNSSVNNGTIRNNMAATGALLGVVSPSPGQGQGSGMFVGLAMARSVCEEEVCEVSANEGSVT